MSGDARREAGERRWGIFVDASLLAGAFPLLVASQIGVAPAFHASAEDLEAQALHGGAIAGALALVIALVLGRVLRGGMSPSLALLLAAINPLAFLKGCGCAFGAGEADPWVRAPFAEFVRVFDAAFVVALALPALVRLRSLRAEADADGRDEARVLAGSWAALAAMTAIAVVPPWIRGVTALCALPAAAAFVLGLRGARGAGLGARVGRGASALRSSALGAAVLVGAVRLSSGDVAPAVFASNFPHMRPVRLPDAPVPGVELWRVEGVRELVGFDTERGALLRGGDLLARVPGVTLQAIERARGILASCALGDQPERPRVAGEALVFSCTDGSRHAVPLRGRPGR